MPELFDPIDLRGLTVPNRIWMSPMCTYSAEHDGQRAGRPTDFHLAHYAARAAGGVGLVLVEATGVVPEGRISPYDLGLWDDQQITAFRRLADAITSSGAVPAIQLAHAGRKASVDRPWHGGEPVAPGRLGWRASGPSDIAFPGYPAPSTMSTAQIAGVVDAFARAATRAHEAGFEVAEVHAAHGYLLHSFLSPVSNHREDEYGGSPENRARIVLEIIDAVRAVWPEDRPVLLRVSTTDWITEHTQGERTAWGVQDAAQLARWAAERGVDLVDASSGGTEPTPIPHDRDYQTTKAARIREETGIPIGAVGRITDPRWAAELISDGQADVVLVGRALLRDASWANHAAVELGATPRYIDQYAYAL